MGVRSAYADQQPALWVVVPTRTFPAGYQVECGDCRAQPNPGELVIDSPPTSDPAVVVIHP